MIMPRRTRVTRSIWEKGKRVTTFFTRKRPKRRRKVTFETSWGRASFFTNKPKKVIILPKKLAIERLATWLDALLISEKAYMPPQQVKKLAATAVKAMEGK